MAEVARLVEDADSQVQAAEERRRRTLNMVPSQRLGSPHEEEVEQGFGSDRWDPPHRGDVPFSSEVAPSAVLVEGPMRGFSGRGGAEVLRATPAPSESAPNAAGPAATEAPMAGEVRLPSCLPLPRASSSAYNSRLLCRQLSLGADCHADLRGTDRHPCSKRPRQPDRAHTPPPCHLSSGSRDSPRHARNSCQGTDAPGCRGTACIAGRGSDLRLSSWSAGIRLWPGRSGSLISCSGAVSV